MLAADVANNVPEFIGLVATGLALIIWGLCSLFLRP